VRGRGRGAGGGAGRLALARARAPGAPVALGTGASALLPYANTSARAPRLPLSLPAAPAAAGMPWRRRRAARSTPADTRSWLQRGPCLAHALLVMWLQGRRQVCGARLSRLRSVQRCHRLCNGAPPHICGKQPPLLAAVPRRCTAGAAGAPMLALHARKWG